MPMYEYKCQACGHRLESIQKFSDKPLKSCPKCKKPRLERQLSTSSIQFKGSGWYITDYAKKSSPESSKSDGEKSDGGKSDKDGGSKESKPEAAKESSKEKAIDKAAKDTGSATAEKAKPAKESSTKK